MYGFERERDINVKEKHGLADSHAPTGNQTSNLGMCPDQVDPQPFGVGQCSHQLSHTSQDNHPVTFKRLELKVAADFPIVILEARSQWSLLKFESKFHPT